MNFNHFDESGQAIRRAACHRIIGADGKLVGYRGGIDIKKILLKIEKRHGTV